MLLLLTDGPPHYALIQAPLTSPETRYATGAGQHWSALK